MPSEDVEYYRERALVETHLASTAKDETAERLHSRLAVHYQAKLEKQKGRAASDPSPTPGHAERKTLRLVWNGKGH